MVSAFCAIRRSACQIFRKDEGMSSPRCAACGRTRGTAQTMDTAIRRIASKRRRIDAQFLRRFRRHKLTSFRRQSFNSFSFLRSSGKCRTTPANGTKRRSVLLSAEDIARRVKNLPEWESGRGGEDIEVSGYSDISLRMTGNPKGEP